MACKHHTELFQSASMSSAILPIVAGTTVPYGLRAPAGAPIAKATTERLVTYERQVWSKTRRQGRIGAYSR